MPGKKTVSAKPQTWYLQEWGAGSRASCLGWTRHTLEEMEINVTYGYLTRGYVILFEEQHSEIVTQWKVWLSNPVGVMGYCNCRFDFTMTHFPLPISPKSSSEWHPGPKHSKFSLWEALQILLENFQLEDKITRVKKKRKSKKHISTWAHTQALRDISSLYTLASHVHVGIQERKSLRRCHLRTNLRPSRTEHPKLPATTEEECPVDPLGSRRHAEHGEAECNQCSRSSPAH